MSAPKPSAELDAFQLEAARRGDARAWRALVGLYERRLFALVDRLLTPRGLGHLVDDVAQETLVHVLRQLRRFRADGPAKLSTWILTIATRRCWDVMRRRERRLRREAWAPPPIPPLPPDATSVGARLMALVGALPPDQHAAFVLRTFHELSYPEIAAALGVPAGTVKSRLSRARARLEAGLKEAP